MLMLLLVFLDNQSQGVWVEGGSHNVIICSCTKSSHVIVIFGDSLNKNFNHLYNILIVFLNIYFGCVYRTFCCSMFVRSQYCLYVTVLTWCLIVLTTKTGLKSVCSARTTSCRMSRKWKFLCGKRSVISVHNILEDMMWTKQLSI